MSIDLENSILKWINLWKGDFDSKQLEDYCLPSGLKKLVNVLLDYKQFG